MYTLRLHFVLLIMCFMHPSCKHHHEVSEDLKRAYSIHLEALEISDTVDSLIGIHQSTGHEHLSFWQQRKALWKENMVEMEGMDHDHKHCDHNHSHPKYSISDAEMVLVQKEWRDSIVKIKEALLHGLDR